MHECSCTFVFMCMYTVYVYMYVRYHGQQPEELILQFNELNRIIRPGGYLWMRGNQIICISWKIFGNAYEAVYIYNRYVTCYVCTFADQYVYVYVYLYICTFVCISVRWLGCETSSSIKIIIW